MAESPGDGPKVLARDRRGGTASAEHKSASGLSRRGVPVSMVPRGCLPADAPKSPAVSPVAAPLNVPSWRSRFVLSAKAQAPRKMQIVAAAADSASHDLVKRADAALEAGVSPTLVDDGLGGSYFVRDEQGRELAGGLHIEHTHSPPAVPLRAVHLTCATPS